MVHTNQDEEQYTDWRGQGHCVGSDPELFFDLAEEDPEIERAAKRVCEGCRFQFQCLNQAMLAGEEYGIFGGMTPSERRRYRAQWEREQGGRRALRALRRDNGIVIQGSNRAVERKYEERLRAAQHCRAAILDSGEDFPRRKEFLGVLELIISNPMEDGGKLARKAGVSKTWFNAVKREIFDLYYSSDVEVSA